MACSSVVDAYASSAAKAQAAVDGTCGGGSLPFTGLNLFVLICIAVILLGLGIILRQLGRAYKG